MIPAMEAGINNMFQQINHSLQSIQPVTAVSSTDNQAIEKLQITVDQVLEKFSSFETQLSVLTSSMKDMQQQISVMTANPPVAAMPWHPGTPARIDPHYLLNQGRVSEALELVVNQENISLLIDLLSKIDTQTLINQSTKPVQLCVVHRLVEDLVIVDPIEGWQQRMEWIKALIMTLLPTINRNTIGYPGSYITRQKSIDNVDNVAEYHMQSAMQQLHQFFGQILERLTFSMKNPSTPGQRNDLIPTPPSMLIADIQLLMAAVGSKLT